MREAFRDQLPYYQMFAGGRVHTRVDGEKKSHSGGFADTCCMVSTDRVVRWNPWYVQVLGLLVKTE